MAIPILDQNLIALLDFNQNHLKIITGLPFEKLPALFIRVVLDLSYNQISQMSSTAFRGLQLLMHLNPKRAGLFGPISQPGGIPPPRSRSVWY